MLKVYRIKNNLTDNHAVHMVGFKGYIPLSAVIHEWYTARDGGVYLVPQNHKTGFSVPFFVDFEEYENSLGGIQRDVFCYYLVEEE